ncbi:MAG TPA: PVC-type heme-binding CxxCH protein [Humisphaera sp.]
MTRRLWMLAALLAPMTALAAPPVATDDRLAIELIAQEPQIVTPTGVACDVRGNVWVIESNTHFPPKDYKGHPTDRVWVFPGAGSDKPRETASGNPAGAAKQVMFCDGVQQGMSIAVTPAGRVYLVCRNEILLLEDKDHDLKPDGPPKTLVKLDTKATYPHNGLNGVALSPDGASLYFCLGLNAGYDYTLTGSDGSKAAGGGEGGSIWRCTPDGAKVARVASGFWNCHDLTFDAFGRLFAVDNDPDDIGPCRLLDIIDGGDYGWKFKNGRKGVHPFTSWNGELPGTLPMVAPTGEAPSGVLAYESDNLPADYRGQLLVTSWGDHVVQRYTLKEKGASVTSTPQEMIRGGEDFRPVGIAQAPDGSVFITDWVDKSYTLHGKGKLWRVRAAKPPQREPRGSATGPSGASAARPAVTKPAVAGADPADQLQRDIPDRTAREIVLSLPPDSDFPLPTSIPSKYRDDPFMTSAAATALSRSKQLDEVLKFGPNSDTEWVVVVDLLAARRSGRPEATGLLKKFLTYHSETVRRLALQWVGEDRLAQFAPDVEAALKAGPITRDLLSAYLACKEKLASEPPAPGKPVAERSAKQFAADFLFDAKNDLAARKIALTLIDPADPKLPAEKLIALVEPMGLEAVKALAWRDDEASQAALRKIAADEKADVEVRKEAIAGLARSVGTSDATRDLLYRLLGNRGRGVGTGAARSLWGHREAKQVDQMLLMLHFSRFDIRTAAQLEEELMELRPYLAQRGDEGKHYLATLAKLRPTDTPGWQKAAADGGDVENGRRLFSLATGGRCYVCHAINGRGGQVGPDLSNIGRAMDRAKIVESIIEPSKEIAPLFVATTLELKDGTSVTGVGLPEPGASFVSVADATGKRHRIKADDIESRRTQKLSIMPEGLGETMTVSEFRDLVAYLASLR